MLNNNEYQIFSRLHHQKNPLLVYNCWNVSTAKLVEQSGQSAVVTSSYAIADSLGYSDGEKMPFDLLLLIVKKIKEHVTIPVSVDIETGYGEQYLENIVSLLKIGVVGINLEDRIIDAQEYDLVPIKEQAAKIKKIVAYSHQNGYELFINARTDLFLQSNNHTIELCQKALERAYEYKKAGAQGIFVPGLTDKKLIKYFVSQSPLPVNLMVSENMEKIDDLAELGVKRVSYGPLTYFHAEIDFSKRLEGH